MPQLALHLLPMLYDHLSNVVCQNQLHLDIIQPVGKSVARARLYAKSKPLKESIRKLTSPEPYGDGVGRGDYSEQTCQQQEFADALPVKVRVHHTPAQISD